MKRIYIKKSVVYYLAQNKWQFLVVFLSLFLGTILGSYFSIIMNAESNDAMGEYINNFVSAYNLQSINPAGVFKFSLYNNVKTILLLWVSGLWIGFIPLTFLQVGVKGYKLGFSTALLVKSFGLKGMLFAVTSAIPQLFITIPVLVFYSVFNINFALFQNRSKLHSISSSLKNEIYIKNLLYLVGLIVLSFFVAFLDAYVMPVVLKPICSIWGK